MLRYLLYSLDTNHHVARHSSHAILKAVSNTNAVGQKTGNDDSQYRMVIKS